MIRHPGVFADFVLGSPSVVFDPEVLDDLVNTKGVTGFDRGLGGREDGESKAKRGGGVKAKTQGEARTEGQGAGGKTEIKDSRKAGEKEERREVRETAMGGTGSVSGKTRGGGSGKGGDKGGGEGEDKGVIGGRWAMVRGADSARGAAGGGGVGSDWAMVKGGSIGGLSLDDERQLIANQPISGGSGGSSSSAAAVSDKSAKGTGEGVGEGWQGGWRGGWRGEGEYDRLGGSDEEAEGVGAKEKADGNGDLGIGNDEEDEGDEDGDDGDNGSYEVGALVLLGEKVT
jgi:hypothetical protein